MIDIHPFYQNQENLGNNVKKSTNYILAKNPQKRAGSLQVTGALRKDFWRSSSKVQSEQKIAYWAILLEPNTSLNKYRQGIQSENLRRYDTNGIFQMQGGKNGILPKQINANRFFWDAHWLEIWSNHFCPSMGPNGGSVATDSGTQIPGTYECL